MADAAFQTADFPGFTTLGLAEMIAHTKAELAVVESPHSCAGLTKVLTRMEAEYARRQRALQGDETAMTPGERLRFIQTGRAR